MAIKRKIDGLSELFFPKRDPIIPQNTFEEFMKKRKNKSPIDFKDYTKGYGFCVVSNRIHQNGERIGYMYRDKPVSGGDSGWRFFVGDESKKYVDDPTNFTIYDLNTIVNLNLIILKFMDAPRYSKFERDIGANKFVPVKDFRWYLRLIFGN